MLIYIPGLIANFVFLGQARDEERRQGLPASGQGCLSFLLFDFFWGPIVFFCIFFIAAMGFGFSLPSFF
ncbi:MAG: hypothetical protein ABIJ39_04520 [Chloroflexota bacterium]